MNTYRLARKRIGIGLITFTIITLLLYHDIVWAGVPHSAGLKESKLAGESLFKFIKKDGNDRLKIEALDAFLGDPETRLHVFQYNKLPRFPRGIDEALKGFFKVLGETVIAGNITRCQVELDGKPAILYFFKEPLKKIDESIGIRNEKDLMIANTRMYWFEYRPALNKSSLGFYREILSFIYESYPVNHPAYRYLREIAEPIFKRMFPDKSLSLYILRSTDINAFVLPDGSIYITDGLLRFVKYREELEFVLAHELWHYKRKHHGINVSYNISEFIAEEGKGRLKEVEADLYSLIKAGEIDINPYGGVVFFQRLMGETKEPGAVSLKHGSLLNRVIQLLYPSRLFDIETMSVTLNEISGDIKRGLLPESPRINIFKTIFSPSDEEIDAVQVYTLYKQRQDLIKKLDNPVVISAGIGLVKERIDRFKKYRKWGGFAQWRYEEELGIYNILMDRLRQYIRSISKASNRKKEVFSEAILLALGIGLNLNEEQEVGIGEELAEAIKTPEDLELLINLLKEDIFLDKNLATGYLPDELAEFIIITALEEEIFTLDTGFNVQGYLDFVARFLDSFVGLYSRAGIRIALGHIYDWAIEQAFYNFRKEELETKVPQLFQRAYGVSRKRSYRNIIEELEGKTSLRNFVYGVLPTLSPDDKFTRILQISYVLQQLLEKNEDAVYLYKELSGREINGEGVDEKSILTLIKTEYEEFYRFLEGFSKGKTREDILRVIISFCNIIHVPLPNSINLSSIKGLEPEDYCIILMFVGSTKFDDSSSPSIWRDEGWGIGDFTRLKTLLESMYKPEKQKVLEERIGSSIVFDPTKDTDTNFSDIVIVLINKYFIKRSREEDYSLTEFLDELREISQIIGNEKSLLLASTSITLGFERAQDFVYQLLNRFDLLNIDSEAKAESLIYISLYMVNKSAACHLQEKALRYLARSWDYDKVIALLEGLEGESIGAIKAIEEIIEDKARTPDQIRYVQKKIRNFMEQEVPESKEFLRRLGERVMFEELVNMFFRNKDSYRELLLALTDPSNNQENLRMLCLRMYLETFLCWQENHDFDYDERNMEHLIAEVREKDEERTTFRILKIGPQGILGYFHSLDYVSRYLILHELLVGKYGILLQRHGPAWLIDQLFSRFIEEAGDDKEMERIRITKEVLTAFSEKAVSQNQYDILYFIVAPILFERFLKSDNPKLGEKNYAREFPGIVRNRLKYSDWLRKAKRMVSSLIDFSLKRRDYRIEEDLLERGFIPVDISKRLNSIGLIIEIAQRLGVVGVRFLQLLGQYLDIPKEIEEEFLKVYDRVIGQSKLSAFSILEKECPDIARDIVDMSPAIEGGSLRTTFTLTMKDGRRLIAKVLNPNAGFHAELSSRMLEQVIECLYQKDPETYATAKMLLPDLRQWIEEDIKSEQFWNNDREFKRTAHLLQDEDWARNSSYKIAVPVLVSCGPRHQIEEFIEGDNLTKWGKLEGEGHNLKEIISLITNHLFGQISEGVLVHSDIHWGNFRITSDKKIYILDRNYYLKLSEQDKTFLFTMMAITDPEPLIENIIDYLLGYPENTALVIDKDSLKASLLNTLSSTPSSRLKGLDVLTIIVLELRKAGFKIPFNMTLMMKNLQSLNRMAKKAGFKDISEAYVYLHQNSSKSLGDRKDIGGRKVKHKEEVNPLLKDWLKQNVEGVKVIDYYCENGQWIPYKVKYMEYYIAGVNDKGERLIDSRYQLSDEEQRRLNGTLKSCAYDELRKPIRLRIVVNETTVAWRGDIDHSSLVHVGEKAGLIWFGEGLFRDLLRRDDDLLRNNIFAHEKEHLSGRHDVDKEEGYKDLVKEAHERCRTIEKMAISIEKAEISFRNLEETAKQSKELFSLSSIFGGVVQDIQRGAKLKFAIPLNTLRNCGDVMLGLQKLKFLARDASVPFELIIYGVETDLEAEGLKKHTSEVFALSQNVSVVTITKAQMGDKTDPVEKIRVIKEIIELKEKEYLAIATDVVKRTEAEELKSRLESELAQNTSIRIIIEPDQDSVTSLSAILGNWLREINNGNFSSINKILPVLVFPQELRERLETQMRYAWEILRAA